MTSLRILSLIYALSSPAAAFSVGHPVLLPVETSSRGLSTTTTGRQALIYGWDDGDDDESTSATLTPMETNIHYDNEITQCSVEGIQVAESISYDADRLGSLARLAVAFSPPERALKLDQIERVDVMCVSQHHIDIQAIICEDGGCLSLAVPIQFPKACDIDAHLEGCVISHLEVFDEKATAVLKHQEENNVEIDDGIATLEYPYWWENPSSSEMVAECKNMCSILNEEEFQPELLALVKDALHKDGNGLSVISARVADIGPAGFCFKVRARSFGASTDVRALDVFSPFGGASKTTVDELRAAVLGTVATAGQPGP